VSKTAESASERFHNHSISENKSKRSCATASAASGVP
jgi:hypothetical protein